MARYLETAKQANAVAKQLYDLACNQPDFAEGDPAGHAGEVAECIARLVNYGLRCAPRAVQSTVRLRAVEAAVKGLPVKVTMEKKTDAVTGKEFNALMTQRILPLDSPEAKCLNKCPHGQDVVECAACAIEADIAFDSQREDRMFGR